MKWDRYLSSWGQLRLIVTFLNNGKYWVERVLMASPQNYKSWGWGDGLVVISKVWPSTVVCRETVQREKLDLVGAVLQMSSSVLQRGANTHTKEKTKQSNKQNRCLSAFPRAETAPGRLDHMQGPPWPSIINKIPGVFHATSLGKLDNFASANGRAGISCLCQGQLPLLTDRFPLIGQA